MATHVQLYRGTSTQNDAYTGLEGEVTVDTTNDTLRVHDGETAGGVAVARDDKVVHTTGTETISGRKIFTVDPYIYSETNTNPTIHTYLSNYIAGDIPSTTQSSGLYIGDDGGTATVRDDSSALADIAGGVYASSGNIFSRIRVHNPQNTSTTTGIYVVYPQTGGTPYTSAPTPSDTDDSSSKIATTAWVDAMLAASGIRYASSVGYNNISSPDAEADHEGIDTYRMQVVDFNNYHTAGEYHVRWYYGDGETTDADGNTVYPTLNAPLIEPTSIYWWDGILTIRILSPATSVSYWRRWVYDLVVLRDATNGHFGQRYIRGGYTTSAYTDKTVPSLFTPWYRVGSTEVEYGNSTYTAAVAASTASVAALSLGEDDEPDPMDITSEAIASYETVTPRTPEEIIADAQQEATEDDD